MDDRIRLMVAKNVSEKQISFFPFTQGGLCSQLPECTATLSKELEIPLRDAITLRVARAEDAPQLYHLLRAYGTSIENYGNLEIFTEEKLETIVKNISLCLLHRYFITFLLIKENTPIAFFQIDPYRLATITEILQQKTLPFWSQFFFEPLRLQSLLKLHSDERQNFLKENFNFSAFDSWSQNLKIIISCSAWLNFIEGSLQTYEILQKQLVNDHWIGNISYNLLPAFQHKGLMSQVLQEVEIFSSNIQGYYLFSDRIATKNIASIALLKHNLFTQGGQFKSYYGPLYRTREHPEGNFSESCVCFYKRIL